MKHYLGISLVLVTLAAIVLFGMYACTAAADHTIASVRNAFSQVFQIQPQITMNQRVILTQTSPIAELAVVSKDELVKLELMQHLDVLSYQIPLTEKDLTVEAVFRLKAGFDLHEPFHVTIDPLTHAIHASLPHAKILSVEQIGDLTFHSEDATLNRVTDEERQKLLNGLNDTAHVQAEQSGLKEDAEKQVDQRLQELFSHNGEKMSIEWSSPTAPKP
jgi:Protein of unknown function (DUF4230)